MLAKNCPNPKGSVPLISGDVLFYNSKVSAPKNPKMVLSPRPPKMAPSVYMREMAMSTEERLHNTHTMKRPAILELLDMGTTTYQKFTDVDLSRAIFQPFPSEIIFQQYEPGKLFEVPLQLRNDDKVPRLIKVSLEFSPYFKVVAPSNSADKIAPGMAAIYTIQFFPEENKDYAHELVCVSEREKFSVPIRCIGARPILDFPDSIDFGPLCPVRLNTQNTVHVRNIGSKEAKFELDAQEPFTVSPSVCSLQVGESMQVSVDMYPVHVGDYSCCLKIAFHSGETLFVDLFGTAVDTNVRLDKNTMLMEKTFISMTTQRTVSIVNQSDYMVHFQWKKLASIDIETENKNKMLVDLETEEAMEKDRFLAEVEVDPQLKDRLSLLYRSFYNRKTTVTQDDVLFNDEFFSIEPLSGDIFPRTEFEVTVVFKPRTVMDYTAVAYCEVSGRQNRMPLRLKGEALGPKVSLSYSELNVGNVYINSIHVFEVVLANRGGIDAIYSILPNKSVHGNCFSFNPLEGLVLPDSHQAITIRYEALAYGVFAEDFYFSIDGTSQQLRLRIIGNTIGPNLKFNVPQLRFNSVSYGFASSLTIKLQSESAIPFEVRMYVPSDGTAQPRSGELTSAIECSSSSSGAGGGGPPKEFTIEPETAIIEAKSSLDVTVTLTSNTLQRYDTVLIVDVIDAGNDIIHLPIKARCVIPSVICQPSFIDYNRCFLRFPYLGYVTLVNDSELATRYEMLPQISGDDLPFHFHSDAPKGIIKPKTTVDVPVTVTVNQVGHHSFTVHFVLFGSREAPLQATIDCFGEGPVVFASEMELDFGQMPVLHNVHKKVTLSNESLVPAHFSTRFHHRGASAWRADPEVGLVPPGQNIDIKVIAFLDDSIKFKDRMFIDIEESSSICVELCAEGHGSTIVSDPPLSPTLDLKSRFCNRKFEFKFTLSNVGRRQQQIFWSTEGYPKEKKRTHDITDDPNDMAVQHKKKQQMTAGSTHTETTPRPHFKLVPSRAALEPGESVDVILEGFSPVAKFAKERMICQTIYNKKTGKQKIMSVDVLASFIEPVIHFSQRAIHFQQNVQPGEEARALEQELRIGNISSLPLTAIIHVDKPFSMALSPPLDEENNSCGQQITELLLDAGQEFVGIVRFDARGESCTEAKNCSKKNGRLGFSYKEHPQENQIESSHVIQEFVDLVGEVNYPNLHFESTEVDFGCILNDTEATKLLFATNNSPLPVRYHWQFEPPENPIVIENVSFMPPATSSVAASGRGGGALDADATNEDEDNFEKSQLDELQSEKSHVNEGRSIKGDQDEEEADRSGAAIEGAAEETTLQTSGNRGDISSHATGADKQKEEGMIGNTTTTSKEEMGTTALAVVNFSQQSSVSKVDKQQSGSEVGVANNSSSANQKTGPVASLASFATAESGRGFGRPDLVNDSQISVAGTPTIEKSTVPSSEPIYAGIEEVFDIMPLYGTMQPGERQKFAFSFYAHAGINVLGRAVCKVEGGPDYFINLSGGANVINYSVNTEPIDFGNQPFDQVCTCVLRLMNCGPVGFEFRCLDSPELVVSQEDLVPGEPLLIPASGFVEANEEVELYVNIIPGSPEPFLKCLRLQVAHFEPHSIEVRGQGVFPRLVLDLPRRYTQEEQQVFDEAKQILIKRHEAKTEDRNSISFLDIATGDDKKLESTYEPSEAEIQMETETQLVKKFYLKKTLHTIAPSGDVTKHAHSAGAKSSQSGSREKELRLPDYVLDFGHVILGDVKTHVLCATNIGYHPISFTIDDTRLKGTGFNTEIERVKNLPGYPSMDSVHSVIGFDPRGAGSDVGPVEAFATIQVKGGPVMRLVLKAEVTQPSIELSDDVIDFGEVCCGQCKIVSIQLHNHTAVNSDWFFSPPQSTNQSKDKSSDRFLPMHLRKKLKQNSALQPPLNFELIPRSGSLSPGQRANIQVKFMPTKEHKYSSRMTIRLAQSSRKVMLQVSGEGREPCVELETNLLEFGPILPHGQGDEKTIVLRNPGVFPIEVYNVEFDTQFMDEERILRMMRGYDQYNTLLLPPRNPGDKLPQELLDWDEEETKKLEKSAQLIQIGQGGEDEAAAGDAGAAEDNGIGENEEGADDDDRLGVKTPQQQQQTSAVGFDPADPAVATLNDNDEYGGVRGHTGVTRAGAATKAESFFRGEDMPDGPIPNKEMSSAGDLEVTPVSAAIARYLDIDLSPEGKKSRNRRGVAIVVHGAPQTGKTNTAEAIAKHYQGTVLRIDQVVLEAIINGNTPAGLKARELCQAAGEALKEPVGDEEQPVTQAPLAGGVASTGDMKQREGSPSGQTKTGALEPATESSATVSGKQDAPGAAGAKGGVPGAKPTGGKKEAGQPQATTAPVESTPDMLEAPPRKLSVASSIAGESGLYSCHLPEDIIVEVLDDRMQMADCYCNVVFDGLESMFTSSMVSSLTAVLRAFNNRKYIFLITLKASLNDLKERELRVEEEKKTKREQQLEAERNFLQEMDEDDYDALSEEQKRLVDQHQLQIKKERMQRDKEKSEEERKKREMEAMLEQQRLEEEAKSKKGGKKKGGLDSAKPDKKDKGGGGGQEKNSKGGKESARAESGVGGGVKNSAKDSRKSHHGDAINAAGGVVSLSEDMKEAVPPPPSEEEISLKRSMRLFEQSIKDVTKVADRWDRSKGVVNKPITPSVEETEDARPGHKGRGGKKEEKKGGDEEEAISGQDGTLNIDENSAFGIPHIILSIMNEGNASFSQKILSLEFMPKFDDILDGLGLGSQGPPIPPPSLFQVVQFPTRRQVINTSDISEHYAFVASSPDDPNIAVPEDGEEEDETETASGGAGGGGTDPKAGSSALAKKGKKSPGNSQDTSKTPVGGKSQAGGKSGGTGAGGAASKRKNRLEVEKEDDGQPSLKLGKFRWVIEAGGEITLKLRFSSNDIGQFDQTLNFEIASTKRRYQLFCRGVCAFPQISKEPRVVFPNRKKNLKKEEIVSKKYIMSPSNEYYEFGPLICGKSRESYLEGRYPENMECLNITNTSSVPAQVAVTFLNDNKGDTFLFHPPSMELNAGESQTLRAWAYPKSPGIVKDTLICCVKENPEPLIFKVQCTGVRPEIELDKKEFKFDKVLLHRKDSRVIYIKNTSLLPVAWRLSGVESLGEDFTMSQEQGIIDAKKEFALTCHFRGLKPTNIRKVIRLEVSDKDQIMGLVQLENIQILAEAYDVALDMSFPKGTEGGIDFGTNRVGETVKQTISLKNKGRYDCGFHLSVEKLGAHAEDMEKLFSVYPNRGSLLPNDRPTTVQITFVSHYEVNINNLPIIKCNIIDPNTAGGGSGGETIACIPIKIVVRALYSKYALLPRSDIDFGSIIVNSKRQLQFAIENMGEFEFKFNITKPVSEDALLPTNSKTKSDSNKAGRSLEATSATARSGNKSSLSKSTFRGEMPMAAGTSSGPATHTLAGVKLLTGPFIINPAFGVVLPKAQQVIQVECCPDAIGRHDEEFAIEISDRDPKDHPDGVPYHVLADAVVPGFNTSDVTSIFEEHVVCRSLALYLKNHQVEHVQGIYSEDENKFAFCNVVVGKSAKARFKITNPHKVKCEVAFNAVTTSSSSSKKIHEVFDVDVKKAVVQPHSSYFAELSFRPLSMQTYGGVFEAQVEGLPTSLSQKFKPLTFELVGDGNLPRVTVVRPTLKNKKASPMMMYRRLLIGQEQTMQLVLVNDGNLRSTVYVDPLDDNAVFHVTQVSSNQSIYSPKEEGTSHKYGLVLSVGEEAIFDVKFTPTEATRFTGKIQISLVDNPFEDVSVVLLGEGYMEDMTIENIHTIKDISGLPIGSALSANHVEDEGEMDSDVIDDSDAVLDYNHLNFGQVFIKTEKQIVFTLVNHSSNCYRFAWPSDHNTVKFSPQEGHIHASCSKDITVTFVSEEPIEIEKQQLYMKAELIEFLVPIEEVKDWDDRQKIVNWVDAIVPKSASTVKEEVKPVKKKGQASEKEASQPELQGPRKKKVTEVRPEPEHHVIEGSQRDIPVVVSAVTGFTKYKLKTQQIAFDKTLMFQSRKYEFSLTNKGAIGLLYNWRIELSDGRSLDYSVPEFRPLSRQNTTLEASTGGMLPDYEPPATPAYVPFSIDPHVGIIPPGRKKTFVVRFAPLDIGDFSGKLVCQIPNLDPTEYPDSVNTPVEIKISGCSEMPCLHFEIPESDYLSGNRRDPSLKGPGGEPPGTLEPNTKVLEFNVTGVGFKTSKTFDVINPTKNAYNYYWTCLDVKNVKTEAAFKVVASKGQILPGQTTQMGFDFQPTDLGVTESFWRFSVPGQKISLLFLLVGTTIEPVVKFEMSHLNFRSVLVGEQSHELIHLVNEEDMSLSYSFDADSIYTNGRSAMIGIMPITGVIPGKSRAPLDLFFTPPTERDYNFNLVCRIKHRIEPLYLNVKAEGFNINADLICESSSGHMVKLTANGRNEINLKEVEPNEQAVRSLHIFNPGRYALSFKWAIKNDGGCVSIKPESGDVKPGNKTVSTLTFLSPKKYELKNCVLTLAIERGPTYHVSLLGKCVSPSLKFSSKKVNFGPSFLQKSGLRPKTEQITITNNDRKSVSMICLYENTKHLEVKFDSCSLDPGQSTVACLTFTPWQTGKIEETVLFQLNGLSTLPLTVLGEGVNISLEAVDGMKQLNFGCVKAGKTVKKQTTLVNRSKVALTFELSMAPTSPRGVTLAHSISLAPLGATLKPNDSCTVTVALYSDERIPNFSEEVYMEMEGMSMPVFSLCGSVIDQSVKLDTEAVPFGAVVVRGESRRRVLMTNDGDIGVYFNWDVAKFKPDFSIIPAKGYIAPGMDLPLEIAFHPTAINPDIRYSNLLCHIEKGKPLKLTLSGVCAACPPTGKELVQFQCCVRETDKKVINISNKTGNKWTLSPVVEGEYFQGPDTLVVDAGITKAYEMTYKPLKMTGVDKKHLGSVFFALPDGSGLLYNLQGTADPPKPADTIIREVASKQSHVELIPLQNWEKSPQRFKVMIDVIKPDKLDSSTQINGLNYLDVPGLTKRDFKLNFYTHKEGNFQIKVTFLNEKSGEYVFYFLNIRVTLPGVIETVYLETPCRHSHAHTINIHNPLSVGVTFFSSCPSPDILMPPQFVIAPGSTSEFTIEYLPLRVEETSSKLVLNSVELGVYTYELNLCSLAPSPQKPLFFRASLGASHTMLASFLNYSKAKCEYTVQIEQSDRASGKEDFVVEKTVLPAAPGTSAGTEVSFEVVFEPSILGDVKAEMKVYSQIGGDYLFILHGTATSPKPQGPYTVKAGNSLTIPFKNVFHSLQQFSFSIDNPAFNVRGNENLKPKKQTNLHVTFEGNVEGNKMPCMGKLLVTCPKSAAPSSGSKNNIVWSYYIKGTH